jgi:hypothetical protein
MPNPHVSDGVSHYDIAPVENESSAIAAPWSHEVVGSGANLHPGRLPALAFYVGRFAHGTTLAIDEVIRPYPLGVAATDVEP